MNESDVRDAIDRYYRVHDSLPQSGRMQAEFMRGQALAYVWGWQDGRSDLHKTYNLGKITSVYRADSEVADAFSWAYATVVALMEAHTITNRPPIQDAWRSWLEHGEIRDYNGRALDRVG